MGVERERKRKEGGELLRKKAKMEIRRTILVNLVERKGLRVAFEWGSGVRGSVRVRAAIEMEEERSRRRGDMERGRKGAEKKRKK